MKSLNRRTILAYAAALGASVLAVSATFVRTSVAQVRTDPLPGSREIVEPTEDPGAEPAAIEKKTQFQSPETAIRKWPEASRVTARAMIAKYGQPERWNEGALTWINNGPWEKTVVYRSWWPRFLGKRNHDNLEQTIAYRVPPEKVDDLKRFDRRLAVDQGRSQLSARSESEPQNFLALNLADEIVTEKRSVEEARDFYGKTERLSKAGKSSAYMGGLLFPDRSDRDLRIDDHIDSYDRNMMP